MGSVCRDDSSPTAEGTVISKAAFPTGPQLPQWDPCSGGSVLSWQRHGFHASTLPLGLQPQTHPWIVLILQSECPPWCLKEHQNPDLPS